MDNITTLLGFDYGQKRIGVAMGQMITKTASPLATINTKNNKPDWVQIEKLIKEWQPQALVVGIPSHADDTASHSTRAAQRFSRQLKERFRLPVYTIDERLSSHAAESEGAYRSGAHGLDAVSAHVILESWLTQCP